MWRDGLAKHMKRNKQEARTAQLVEANSNISFLRHHRYPPPHNPHLSTLLHFFSLPISPTFRCFTLFAMLSSARSTASMALRGTVHVATSLPLLLITKQQGRRPSSFRCVPCKQRGYQALPQSLHRRKHTRKLTAWCQLASAQQCHQAKSKARCYCRARRARKVPCSLHCKCLVPSKPIGHL